MPATGRSGREEFLAAHIPGARFLDIDEVSDASDPAPHALPSAEAFAAAMERAGIGSNDRIVVYDNSPFGPRRAAGSCCGILAPPGRNPRRGISASGLPRAARRRRVKCNRERRPSLRARGATSSPRRNCCKAGNAPCRCPRQGSVRRHRARPPSGLVAGHIPGARNLPFGTLYGEDGTLRPKAELARLFRDAGIDPAQPFTATCGSGVTATSLIFAAHLLGNDRTKLYDGSWSEWGADPATPKAVGPA